MLQQCISAEWIKLRRSYLWIVMMSLPLVSVCIGCANFAMNQGVLKNEWYSLWSQVSLFYGEFFFPILIAICSAYLCRLEHANRNWNMIMTAPVSVGSLFIAKVAVISVLLLLVQGFFFILYVAGGMLIGLQADLPPELPGWLFRGWIAAVAIGVLQLALSVRIRSFAAPVGIGLCMTFLGLGMYVMNLGLIFPHSLLTAGMGVLSQEGLGLGSSFLFYVMNLLYIVVISAGVMYRMRSTDVVS
ncbi:ABC transporter permease [Brevibacillus panacihumi]|uniref:Multidrug ABC transporter permease n=1 Tax=Brevibacillus panacihumi TaxID=497735 RepID=A0A3M8CP06_9BACL|nr:ABC transporter permease [Brevibacillus panacihumi]RNB77482.1 multidrug ABC transporter permease [Brevibacillus panacihumi]